MTIYERLYDLLEKEDPDLLGAIEEDFCPIFDYLEFDGKDDFEFDITYKYNGLEEIDSFYIRETFVGDIRGVVIYLNMYEIDIDNLIKSLKPLEEDVDIFEEWKVKRQHYSRFQIMEIGEE